MDFYSWCFDTWNHGDALMQHRYRHFHATRSDRIAKWVMFGRSWEHSRTNPGTSCSDDADLLSNGSSAIVLEALPKRFGRKLVYHSTRTLWFVWDIALHHRRRLLCRIVTTNWFTHPYCLWYLWYVAPVLFHAVLEIFTHPTLSGMIWFLYVRPLVPYNGDNWVMYLHAHVIWRVLALRFPPVWCWILQSFCVLFLVHDSCAL